MSNNYSGYGLQGASGQAKPRLASQIKGDQAHSGMEGPRLISNN